MAQISRVRRVRAGAHCVKWNTVFLELTWIRLLPQSATMILPLVSTATPVGALNWPLPSPWEPNLYRNSPSALYTCRKNNWPVTCLSHRNCFCVTGKMTILKQQQETCVLACLLNQKQYSFAILNVCKIVSSSHTLTEWLWKSVTTISFLLFTATKWGPGISRGNKKGKKERKDESPRIFQCVAGSSTLFLDWTENVQHGGDKDTRWCERVCETRQKLSSSVEKKKKKKDKDLSHSWGKHLLTESRARFTKLLFQCNVCTALFYEKRKGPSERWDWKKGWLSELSLCNKRCIWKHSWKAKMFHILLPDTQRREENKSVVVH